MGCAVGGQRQHPLGRFAPRQCGPLYESGHVDQRPQGTSSELPSGRQGLRPDDEGGVRGATDQSGRSCRRGGVVPDQFQRPPCVGAEHPRAELAPRLGGQELRGLARILGDAPAVLLRHPRSSPACVVACVTAFLCERLLARFEPGSHVASLPTVTRPLCLFLRLSRSRLTPDSQRIRARLHRTCLPLRLGHRYCNQGRT